MSFGRSGPHVNRLKSGAKIVTFNLDKARLHTYVAPEKSFGDASHIIESVNFLTIVDTQYMVPYSEEFRAYANKLGKPIAGVIISHAHPDHYFGLTSAFSDVPSYALSEVIEEIKKNGPIMIEESKKELGDLVPDRITVPTNILELGDLVIDGITYRYKKFDKAEADSQVVIELPELNTVIVQDAVYNGYHPWLGQYTDNWINLLNTLKKDYKDNYVVLVGHGNPASPEIYDEMKKYLMDSKQVISKSRGDRDKIMEELVRKYPKYKGRKIIPMYLAYMFDQNQNEQKQGSEKNPVNWFEIPVEDMDRAVRFYESVFGYHLKKVPPFPSDPNTEMAWFPFLMDGEGAAGSLVRGPYYRPSAKGTLVYFRSPSGDLSNELSKVEVNGGKVIQNKRLISEQIGYMGIFMDPEGNKVALHSRN